MKFEIGELVQVEQHWIRNEILNEQFAIFLGPSERYNNSDFIEIFLQNDMKQVVTGITNLKKVSFEYFEQTHRKETEKASRQTY